jgi:hypothetical protein
MKGARVAWIQRRDFDSGEMYNIDDRLFYIQFHEPEYNEVLYDKVLIIPLEEE